MEPEAYMVASLLCFAFLLYVFDFSYRKYRIDLLRFYLFRARDRLFDAAEKGVIPFDDPAYGMTRQMLNGMIRFAHELSLWRPLVIWASRKQWDPEEERTKFWKRYCDAVDSLPVRSKTALRITMTEAHICVLSHVLHTSLITFPFVFIGKWILKAQWKVRQVANLIENPIARPVRQAFDREAYLVGDGETSLAA